MRDDWESEAEMAARVVEWLELQGYDVYQEVEYLAGIADIVAIKNRQIMVVECKMQFSFHVVEQANNWAPYADFTVVAVPSYYPKGSSRRWLTKSSRGYPAGWSFGFAMCSSWNIGVMLVGKHQPLVDAVYAPHGFPPQSMAKSRDPRALTDAQRNRFLSILRPEHKTYAKAGSPTGRRWSPYKETCEAFRKYVAEHPGITLKEACAAVKHHYSSQSSMVQRFAILIPKGAVPGVKLTSVSGPSTSLVFPDTETSSEAG